LLGISLSGSLKLIVDPRQTSRFFALKDQDALRKGMWVAIGGLALVQLCLYPIGVYAHLLLENVQDTDLIVPLLVSDTSIFPLWAGDFLFVAIVAAAMSSMDSVLLVAASTGYKNLLQPFYRNHEAGVAGQLRWTRGMVVALAILAAGIALDPPGDILQLTIFSGSLYAVCFFARCGAWALLVQGQCRSGSVINGRRYIDSAGMACPGLQRGYSRSIPGAGSLDLGLRAARQS
jgi:Na+/pantothenate symporter